MELTGGASITRNRYFSLSWNTYSISEETFRTYRYKNLPGITLQQKMSNGYVSLQSIAASMYKNSQALSRFMETFLFYALLMTKDSSLPKIGFVYLLIFEDHFKIGKSFNFEKRYNKSTKEKLVSIVPVKDQDTVEKRLINKYKEEGYKLVKGKEYFKLDTKHHVETIFHDTIGDDKVTNFEVKKSKLITTLGPQTRRQNIYIHPSIGCLLVNRFAETEEKRVQLNKFLELISKQISNGYFDEIYDNQNKSVCSYWLYFNFVGIRRWKDNKVNISRMFNSIKKQTKKYNKRPLREFTEYIQQSKSLNISFKERYPERTMVEFCENKEQPYLSGYYLDAVLVPTFVSWASKEALLSMNELLIHLGSEAFANSSIDEAKTRVEVREYLVSRKLISSDTYYCT